MSDLRELLASLRAALARFDASALTGAECAALLAELTTARKTCEATEAVVAARAAANGAHRRAGYAAAPDWLAALSGSTVHDARVALETVAEVAVCPDTRDALFSGRVSMAQAREITQTEMVAPGNEADCSSSRPPAVCAGCVTLPANGAPRPLVLMSCTRVNAPLARSCTGATSSGWCATGAARCPRWAFRW